MELTERITKDLTGAMKARETLRTSVLRMAKAAVKNLEIEKSVGGKRVNEEARRRLGG